MRTRNCISAALLSCFLFLTNTAAQAQTPLPPGSGITSLDVISVKPNKSGGSPGNIHPLPDGIRMDNIPLILLLRIAYGLTYNREIVGAPDWARSESFDIEARVAEGDIQRFNRLSEERRMQNILQIILADRFKLVAHRETQRMAGYALLVAKKGSPLQPRSSNASPTEHTYLSTSTGKISMRGKPIASLASALTRQTEKPVQDRSGLEGDFDVDLHWTDEMNASVSTDSPGPGLFTALQEQLGLRLEPAKVQVECVVVDHIEKPEAN